jgi:transcriptional regulator with XRE-family HTH domain
MSKISNRIGQLIRKIRERKGVSQATFARFMGETRDRVAKVECNITKADVDFLSRLRSVYRVSLDKLFDRVDHDG